MQAQNATPSSDNRGDVSFALPMTPQLISALEISRTMSWGTNVLRLPNRLRRLRMSHGVVEKSTSIEVLVSL